MGEPLGERRGRERGDRDDGDPFLTETLELTPDGVKLSGRRDEAGASAEGQGGEPAHDQLVRVRSQRDGAVRVVEQRSEEHTSELQSQSNLVCRLLLEKKKKYN